MKRRWLSIFLTFTMILLMLPNAAITAAVTDNSPWKGSGTVQDPYRISSRTDLEKIADAVNSGDELPGVYFEQTQNIDLGGDEWPTIGITINNAAHQFRGVFDGGDNKIYNLYVDRHDDDAGLFGYVGQDGVIKNVHIEDGDVSGTYWVGGIAGRNYGIVEYCSFSGYVYGSQQFIGGIVGDNHGGIVRYCYNLGDVEFDQIGGGVAGRNSGGTVENCYNRGDVYSNNIVRGYAGGVVGENTANSTVDNCYSDGWVDGSLACGAIVGANGEGSSVESCYYPEEFEDAGLSGVGGSTGKVENVTPKSDEQFDSGEVAWELSQGTNGEGWGQTLQDDDGHHDKHPHFTQAPDKDYDTTEVYRVTFTAKDPNIYSELYKAYYIDPGYFPYDLPQLPPEACWYVDGVEFDFKNIIDRNIDAYAGKRILFAGEDGTIVHTLIYSTEYQLVDLDLYMKYAEGGPYSDGRFEYRIIDDIDGLGAELLPDAKTLIVPAKTSVKEGGYTLKISAHEKKPFILPLVMGPFGTQDVELIINIVIDKATPVISAKPDASAVDFGAQLSKSKLSGGTANHPTTAAAVSGTFAWSNNSTIPTVTEADITGYYATFTPDDDTNYNTATTMVTLKVNKTDSNVVKEPTPINSEYNGMAENLIVEGKAENGTMKYWITDNLNAVPPEDNFEYSSTIPSRTNAGTYRIWYKVIGDENHKDTKPDYVDATISPYPLKIGEQHVTYNGGTAFTIALNGIKAEGEDSPRTVIAYLTAYSKNKGDYVYSTAAVPNAGEYTIELSNSNYVVGENAGKLVIEPLPVVLKWVGQLAFISDGKTHTVKAEVTNGIIGDLFDLEYKVDLDNKITNSASDVGSYTAEVIGPGNPNYTLEGAQNVIQPWRIYDEDENITLTAKSEGTEKDSITYGDQLTLTADVNSPFADSVKVYFFVNGQLIENVSVTYSIVGGKVIATLNLDNATSQYYFSLGANILRAEYKLYDDTEGMDVITIFVSPKTITAKITGNTDKTYDGNDVATGLEIEFEGAEDYDDVTAAADNFTYNSADAAKATTVTANNVTLSGAQSGNYVINGKVTTDGKIESKSVKLEWRGSTGLVYNGSSANVNATAHELIPGDVCTVNVTNGSAINAGDYTAVAAGLSNSNYKLPDDETITQKYTIAKADLYITEQSIRYNGTTEFAAKSDGVTMADGSAEQVDVDISAGSADVGDYIYSADGTEENVYTAITNNVNYRIAGGAILTIEKIDPIYKAPVPNKLTYNGEVQELINEGEVDGGEMQYSFSEDGTYYTSVPTGIEVGTYIVWYRVVGDKNHNDVAPQSIEVTISPYDNSDNLPDGPQKPDVIPNTGIEANLAFCFWLMCIFASAAVVLIRKVK